MSPRTFFYLSDFVSFLFFVNSAAKFLSFGCHPLEGVIRGASSSPSPLVTPQVHIIFYNHRGMKVTQNNPVIFSVHQWTWWWLIAISFVNIPQAHRFQAVLISRRLRGLAPRYLSDYIQRVADSNRRRLRSSSSSQLVIRRTRLSSCQRSIGSRLDLEQSAAWRHSPSTFVVFFGIVSKLTFSTDHFVPNCFG